MITVGWEHSEGLPDDDGDPGDGIAFAEAPSCDLVRAKETSFSKPALSWSELRVLVLLSKSDGFFGKRDGINRLVHRIVGRRV